MRVVIQRVKAASVMVGEVAVGEIGLGLFLLLGISPEDNEQDITWLVNKIIQLRIFPDQEGKMNCSLRDIDGELLLVSQFTLFASVKKGTKPSFIKSAKPVFANEMYELFKKQMSEALGKKIPSGIFGKEMVVSSVNWGPVTINVDSKNRE